MTDLGLLGIFTLMLLDCACIPVPSEVTMLFAGFSVSQGHYSLAAVVIAGALGNLVGSQIAYAAGYHGGGWLSHRRIGRFLVHERAPSRAREWFDRYGSTSVFVGRLLPLVRTLISLPAGFGRMPFWRFLVFTLLGCVPWALAERKEFVSVRPGLSTRSKPDSLSLGVSKAGRINDEYGRFLAQDLVGHNWSHVNRH